MFFYSNVSEEVPFYFPVFWSPVSLPVRPAEQQLAAGRMQRQPAAESSSSSPGFTPLVVLELASDTKEEACAWLLSRIRDPQRSGGVEVTLLPSCSPRSSLWLTPSSLSGAELLVEQLGPGVLAQDKDNPNLYLVGATWQRLLSGAEDVGLFKEYSDGSMRGFTWANRHNFKDFKGGKFSLLYLSVC